jgi:NTP pyrophosphatase (non-canonical NTP hydrolase)
MAMSKQEIDNIVDQFVIVLKEKLHKNLHKGGWRTEDYRYLLSRLKEETDELENALNEQNFENAIKECADVAAFTIFINDRIING